MDTAEQQNSALMLKDASDLDQIYLKLTRNGLLWENELDWFLRTLCKTISDALNTERVGIYLLNEDQSSLRQQTLFTASTQQHTHGLNLKKRNYPKYFKALFSKRCITANNAHTHAITREFLKSYLIPLNIGAKLDCSLYKTGNVIGSVCVEHSNSPREWTNAEIQFLASVAELISQRFVYEDVKQNSTPNKNSSDVDNSILDSSPHSILLLSKDGSIEFCNQATKDLLGYEDELLTKDFCSVLLTAPERTKINSSETGEIKALINFTTLKKQILKGTAENSECFFRHNDGSAIPVSITLREISNSAGIADSYLCTVSDISQQVSVRQALIAEEERYRFVFEGSADGIFLMEDDIFTDCNQATLNMFECTREQIVGQTPARFSPEFQPDGRKSGEKAFEKITGAFNGESQFFEWQHCRYDGTTFDAEVTLNKVELYNKPHLLASVRDISLRKNSERELKKSRQIILEHNESLAIINDLSNQLHAIDSTEQIYSKTMEALNNLPHNPRIAIYNVNDEAQELHYRQGSGFEDKQLEPFQVIPFNQNFTVLPLRTGEPLYSPDIENDQRLFPDMKLGMLALDVKSMIEIPLIYQEKKMAMVILTYDRIDLLSIEDIEAMYSIGKSVSLALANAQSRTELNHIAHHDSLTGLTNRAYFHKNFKPTILKGGYDNAALYLLDLDRFKEINDTLGHFTGDKILQQIGPRLRSVIKHHEFIVSRLGGDEFILMAFGVADSNTAQNIAKDIINCIHEPFIIDDLKLEIETSVGIALYPKDGMDSHGLLRSADVAMYQAKQIGGSHSFYCPDNDIHTPERLAMIAEMGSSITSGQLFLHYQPKIDLRTNEITGFEALSRWEHPRLGLLGPNMFIPLIEMSNSISALTEEVLHQALAQQMQWRKNGLDYSVAVNISARNLIDDSLIGMLSDMLDYYDTPPGKLELEITETALMHDAFRSVEILNQISKMGIILSIDDFGTGYSSLSYLKNLPIHKLKLDREFIMGMLNNQQGANIVETIIKLANTLDLEVIAEGVEDRATLNKLVDMNCDTAQGYYICRPNTWENIEHWLKKR